MVQKCRQKWLILCMLFIVIGIVDNTPVNKNGEEEQHKTESFKYKTIRDSSCTQFHLYDHPLLIQVHEANTCLKKENSIGNQKEPAIMDIITPSITALQATLEISPITEVYETSTIEFTEQSTVVTEIPTRNYISPTNTIFSETSFDIQYTTPALILATSTYAGPSEETIEPDTVINMQASDVIKPTRTIMTLSATTLQFQTEVSTAHVVPTSTSPSAYIKESIYSTIPPDVIILTDTYEEIDSISTVISPEPIRTAAPTTIDRITDPVTEHIGILEPTSTTNYLVASNNILITTLTDTIEPTNTSVIVTGTTSTPSLPNNISKIIIL